MKRRTFIALVGGAAAWPLVTRAQQQAIPVVGFLHDGSFAPRTHLMAAFARGLGEAGFVDGRDVLIEYHWAQDQSDRLPALATHLVQRQVAVIATPGSPKATVAAKAATAAIPIAFSVGADPVKLGLVASLNRPGGNVTGVSYFTNELGPKRLGLLLELMAGSADIFMLANPKNATTDSAVQDVRAAATEVGRQCRQPIGLILRPLIFDQNVAAIDDTGFAQAPSECCYKVDARLERPVMEKPDHRHRRLLRARRERPRRRCAAEQRYERAAVHWITLSARSTSPAGTSYPMAFAAFRLMTSS